MWRRVKISVVSFVMVSVFFGQFLYIPETTGAWGNAAHLSTDDGNPSLYPEVSVACENEDNEDCKNIHVVWLEKNHQYEDGDKDPICDAILYKTSSDYGTSWGDTTEVSHPHYYPNTQICGNAGKPSISVYEGVVYVLWPNAYDFYTNPEDGRRYFHIYLNYDAGAGFQSSDIQVDDTITFGSNPTWSVSRIIGSEMAEDEIGASIYAQDDFIHAVWETEFYHLDPAAPSPEFSIRYDRAATGSPGSWGTDQLISKQTALANGEDPDVDAYGDGGYVHVVFTDTDPYYGLYYQKNTNDGASGSWLANPIPLTVRYVEDPWNPSISVYEKYVHVAWEDRRYGSDSSYIYYLRSRDNGANWDTPGERISDGATSAKGTAGSWTSIVVDGNGNVHMSWRDATDSDLKYSVNGGTPVTVDSDGDTGLWNSLARDGTGGLHISYYDATNGDLRYAYCAGTCTSGNNWYSVTADDTTDDVGQYSSIALDSNGHPYISYLDATNGDLRYATCSGSCTNQANWNDYAVDTTGDVGYYTSIAMYGDDPSISYYDLTNGNLKYAERRNSVWGTVAADTTGNVGLYTSLAMESNNDYPHISYYDDTNGDLKYAKCTAANCLVTQNWGQEVAHEDTLNSVGLWADIAFDSDGNPHISYYDGTDGNLMHAWGTGCFWCKEIVDWEGDVGKYSSIALDSNDNVLISYYDDDNDYLKLAKKTSSGWTLRSLEDVGEDTFPASETYAITSLAIDGDDYAHIAFHDINDNNPRYGYDTAGGWASAKLETGNGKNGNWISLALDSNYYVHIAYYDSSSHLKYAFCNSGGCDAPGDFSKTTVDSGATTGKWNSIAVLSNDKPCISYFDDNNDDLKYAEYDTSWTTVTVDSTDFVGPYTSLAIDGNDYRHISYLKVTGVDLRYARCTGTCTTAGNWNPVTVDSTWNVGMYSSIALDGDDRPHIAYYDDSNGALKHAWCKAGSCGANDWDNEYVHSDALAPIGWFTSIELDSNSKPHISYFDPVYHDLWYAEKTGASWNKEPVDTACHVGDYASIDLDTSDKPFIGYHDDSDTNVIYADKTGTDWSFTTVDDTAGYYPSQNRYNRAPRVASVGETIHVVWTLDSFRAAPTCRACDIKYDKSMDNGDSKEWGADATVAPLLYPFPAQGFTLRGFPDIAASGNDLHVVYVDVGTHEYKVGEVQYKNLVDTITETDMGTLDYPLKGTVAVYATYLGIEPGAPRVFVIGGVDDEGNYYDDVWMYNPYTNSVSWYCDFNGDVGLAHSSAVWDPDADMIYIFGGVDSSADATENIFYVDLTNPQGTKCDDTGYNLVSNIGLYGTSAVFDGSDAYIFGGYTTGSVYTDMIQKYSGSNAVDTAYNLDTARAFTSAIIDDSTSKAYIFGGIGTNSVRFDDILMFDTSSPGDADPLNTALPTLRDGTSAAFDGTYGYVFGGEDGTGLLKEIVRFNPTGNWDVGGTIMCKKLSNAVRDTSATATINVHVASGGGIRIFGGDKGSGTYSDKIAKYEPSYWVW